MVLKDGWLNRQLDQVAKNVNTWPEWMKRAGRLDSDNEESKQATNIVEPSQNAGSKEQQQTLSFKKQK